MDVFNALKKHAEQIGGTFSDYDHTKAIVVVPLSDGRFQTILAILEKGKVSGKNRLTFTSKITEFREGIDMRALLEQNAQLDYARFILEDGQLKLAATVTTDSLSEDEIGFILQEVAQIADQYEFSLTGKDIH
jgi:hypothetical protein